MKTAEEWVEQLNRESRVGGFYKQLTCMFEKIQEDARRAALEESGDMRKTESEWLDWNGVSCGGCGNVVVGDSATASTMSSDVAVCAGCMRADNEWHEGEKEKVLKLYNELLFEVASKHPEETRHETAKRYICEYRDRPSGCAQVNPDA